MRLIAPFSGLCVRFRACTLHLAKPQLPKAAVPGGWIDLTREGFCYAANFGILSLRAVTVSSPSLEALSQRAVR
jgi:hypothetical protein